MRKKKETLLDEVKKEAWALREHATPEEVLRLRMYELSAFHANSCIYGQMTGSCYSDRAHHLIARCCTMGYRSADRRTKTKMPKNLGDKGDMRMVYSPIEVYLMKESRISREHFQSAVRPLVSFLKGETNKLTLK